MTIHNNDIAAIFDQLADLLEIKGDNPFRVRAYRNAARVIANLSKNAIQLQKEGFDFTTLPAIGKDLADKIAVIIETGQLPLLKQIQKSLPSVLTELLKIEGLGPKRVLVLYKKLHVKSLDDLKKILDQHKILKLKGFGEKTEEKIRLGIEHVKTYAERIRLADAVPIVDDLIHYLKQSRYVQEAECAGSFRRRKETVGDLDFLVGSDQQEKVIDYFIHFPEIAEVNSKGTTRSAVRLKSGLQIDLRVVQLKSYGAALLYFTGSKSHNIALRRFALRKHYKINEYGIFKKNKALGGVSEEEIYHHLGMTYILPELRENRGEIELAKIHQLPQLIQLQQIRGDLHCHTKETDGNATLEEMAKEAKSLGYQYLAITDHTKHLAFTKGMDKKAVHRQIKLIDRLNEKLNGIQILKSAEVDILENGKLDLPDDVLKELDLTICSIHSKFNLPQKKQTERMIKAMENRYFNILGHPTGRLINQREPYPLDIDRIMLAAKERGCILEINAQPSRLDLNDIHCKAAKEMGIKFAISTDAHSTSQLHLMCFGIYQARRGWLEAKDVINTYRLEKLLSLLKR